MKTGKFLLIVLITILMSFSLTFLFYNFFVVVDIQELDMKLKTGDIVGIDVNKSVISFGIVPPGGGGERPVIIKNMKNEPLRVHIKKSGELKKFVYVSENNFVLEPNETKELKFKALSPGGSEEKEYQGKVTFVFRRLIW